MLLIKVYHIFRFVSIKKEKNDNTEVSPAPHHKEQEEPLHGCPKPCTDYAHSSVNKHLEQVMPASTNPRPAHWLNLSLFDLLAELGPADAHPLGHLRHGQVVFRTQPFYIPAPEQVH